MTHPTLSNLWDMLAQYGAIVSWLTTGLNDRVENLSTDLLLEENRVLGSSITARRLAIDDADNAFLSEYLPHAKRLADELALDAVCASVRRIADSVSDVAYSKYKLRNDLSDLQQRLHDQLVLRHFVYVSPRDVDLYERPDLFGQQVNDAFPAAQDDIEASGTALALGMATTCVIHLMRALEVGLKALARELDISYAPSWDAYLNKIDKKITAKNDSKSIEERSAQSFYQDVAADLMTVKRAWRNPTMHVEKPYSDEQARVVFLATKELMQRMATRLAKER